MLALSHSGNEISFGITPNAYRYFRLPNQQIFFAKPDIFTQGATTLRIDQLDTAGRITAYSLLLPEQYQTPVYYFDGERFIRLPASASE